MSKPGIYYIATGDHFVREAEISAQSVRDAMPDIPIAIATDVEPEFDYDYVIDIPDPEHGFVDQINNLHRSPFDRTLHFDTDIYVGSDVSDLFELLNRFDIAVAHNHNREVYDPPSVPDCFPEYNTGVIAYQNDGDLRGFTRAWKENYESLVREDKTQNQPSFRKTLYESNLRVATLPPEYNCMVRYPGHVRNEVKIGHSRLLDIETPGASKSVNVTESINKLNKYKGHRLYVPNEDDSVSIVFARLSNEAPLHKKAIHSIRTYGFIHTAKHGIPYLVKRLRGDLD